MSNIIKIKHGSTPPTNSNLEEYELGYCNEDKGLYINSLGEIIHLNERQQQVSMESIFNILYPIGSVYFTEDINFNPNQQENWFGTWEEVSGCYLYLGKESTGQIIGDNNNEIIIQDHTLNEAHLPSHTHSLSGSVSSVSAGTPSGSISVSMNAHNHTISGTIGNEASHTHWGYYRGDIQTGGSAQVLCTSNNTNGANASSAITRAYSGQSHSHSFYGESSSVSPSGSGAFYGNTLPSHSHSLNATIGSTGNNNSIAHVAELNPSRFVTIAWKRII